MIETARLILRPWRDDDRAPFAAMGQDPEVMRHLGPVMDRAASDAIVDRLMAMQALNPRVGRALLTKRGRVFA